MVVAQLAQNHVGALMRANPLLTRFLLPSNLLKSAVVVTHVFPGSAIQEQALVGVGSIIQSINNVPIKTIEDFRTFIPPKDFIPQALINTLFTYIQF